MGTSTRCGIRIRRTFWTASGSKFKVDMIASKNAVEIEYTGQQLINAIHITKEKEPVIAVKRNGQEEDHGEE